MKVNLYTSNNGFNQGLAAFTKSAAAIDKQVHSLLLSAINLAAPGNGGDRNVDRVKRVLEAMPKSSRRKAAIHWCREFAPLTIKDDRKTGLSVNIRKDHKSINWTFDVDKAMDKPFWDFSVEKNPAPIDPIAMLKNTADNIRKALNGEGNRPLKGDPEQAERIMSGLEELRASLDA